jgi:hypothetical protein
LLGHFSARYTNEFTLMKEARQVFQESWIAIELRPIMTDPVHEKGIIKAKVEIKMPQKAAKRVKRVKKNRHLSGRSGGGSPGRRQQGSVGQGRPAYGGRPSYGSRPPYGDRPLYPPRERSYGDRPLYPPRERSYGDRPLYPPRERSYGDRPLYPPRDRGYGDRLQYGSDRPLYPPRDRNFGDRPTYGSDRPLNPPRERSYGDRPLYPPREEDFNRTPRTDDDQNRPITPRTSGDDFSRRI